MPCIDKRVMNLSHSASEPHFSLPATSGTSTAAKSPTNNNLKATFKNFPTCASKLDRTQSLRTNVRPLGPFNGQRTTLDVRILKFLVIFDFYNLRNFFSFRALMIVDCQRRMAMWFLRQWSSCLAGEQFHPVYFIIFLFSFTMLLLLVVSLYILHITRTILR